MAAVSARAASRRRAPAPKPLPKPSENAGRKGTYQCKTSHAGSYELVVTVHYDDSSA